MNRTLISSFVPVLLVVLAGCSGGPKLEIPGFGSKETEEEKIAKILDDVQMGMETKKVYKVMAHVSANYLDQEGRDYEGIRKYLNDIMKNYREIVIRRSNPTIVIEGDRARAVDPFGTRAEPDNSRVPPLNIQGQVSVYFEREEGKWKIVEWGSIS